MIAHIVKCAAASRSVKFVSGIPAQLKILESTPTSIMSASLKPPRPP